MTSIMEAVEALVTSCLMTIPSGRLTLLSACLRLMALPIFSFYSASTSCNNTSCSAVRTTEPQNIEALIVTYLVVCASVHRSKRHKSGSMEEEADSPGGEYYHSPSSPASSSRNWTDDMEGGNTTATTTTNDKKKKNNNNKTVHWSLKI